MASRLSLLGVSRSFVSGGCPQLAPVRAGGLRQAAWGLQLVPAWAGGLRQAAWGLQLVPVRAGGLRQAARGLRLAPVRAGGLRESQWECVELGGGAFGGEAHPGRVGRGDWVSP